LRRVLKSAATSSSSRWKDRSVAPALLDQADIPTRRRPLLRLYRGLFLFVNRGPYRAFEASIIADYDAYAAVERELVLRLASLLWRIRRATGIETDLLRIQAGILRRRSAQSAPLALPRLGYRVLRSVGGAASEDAGPNPEESDRGCQPGDEDALAAIVPGATRQITHCFLRLANLDNAIFDRLSRYEAVLWRQAVQTMYALEPLRRQRYRY
jgi:hypothetical protein